MPLGIWRSPLKHKCLRLLKILIKSATVKHFLLKLIRGLALSDWAMEPCVRSGERESLSKGTDVHS